MLACRRKLIGLVACFALVGLLFASAPTPAAAQSATDTTNDPGAVVIPDKSDISQLTVDELTAAIQQAAASAGISMSPEDARRRAQGIKDCGDLAYSLSFVTTRIAPGSPPALSNLVQIVTIIGANAEHRVEDHESAHRIINETLATGSAITQFLNILIKAGSLSSATGDATNYEILLNAKLLLLDKEINGEWESVTRFEEERKDIDEKNQKGYGQELAALKRDVFLALLQKLADEFVAANGGRLTLFQILELFERVDEELIYLGTQLTEFDDVDREAARERKNLAEYIEELEKAFARRPR